MVRVVVCVKRVPKKMEVHIQANARPVLEGLEMQLDPNAKAAVLHGAELVQKHTGRLVALSFTRNEHALRESLALGADDAVLVRRPEQYSLDSTSVAAILAAAVHRIGGVDLVLLGARSADNMAGEVGPQLAHRLNVPYVGHAVDFEIEGGRLLAKRHLSPTRVATFEADLPAVVTVAGGPRRFPTAWGVREAYRKKSVTSWDVSELGLGPSPFGEEHLQVSRMQKVEATYGGCEFLEGEPPRAAEQLVRRLRSRGLIR